MQIYFTMPKPGETIREGSVVKWLKNIGENLEEKTPLVELETEKAVFTADSPFRGVLKKILIKENESVNVGTPLALFEVSEGDGEKYSMLGVGVPVEKLEESLVSDVVSEKKDKQEKAGEALLSNIDRNNSIKTQTFTYSPFIRKLAEENDLSVEDLSRISYAGERLTKDDLLNFLKNRKTNFSLGGNENKEYELIAFTPIRHRIAEHLAKSHKEIPQAATSVDVDMTNIMEFRKNKKFSPFHFFAYAVKEVLKRNLLLNSNYVEENGKAFIRKYQNIHLGFAVATEQGLFNPVIKKSEELDFKNLSSKIVELETKAKKGVLSVDQLTGMTFLVNNPGAIGGSRSYQLIPSPIVAMIGLNKIQKKPWVIEDKIVPREIAVVDLSFDHRVLDGAEAIRFTEEVRKYLEKFPYETIVA